jgi:L-threonylcarbamoyladenylate synthase
VLDLSSEANKAEASHRATPPAAVAAAIEALRAGELVVYPTETFYAVGADARASAALERIFALKGREPNQPIALIAADTTSAFALACEIPALARRLADAFWPGPLTLVLPAARGLHPALVGPDGGVGVRVSPHPLACALASGLGRPLTATSANLSGHPPAATLAAARAELGDRVKVYLDGGTLAGGAPSTVVAMDAGGYRIIRAGAINARELAAALSIESLT